MVSMLSRPTKEMDAGVINRGRSVRVADTTTESSTTAGPNSCRASGERSGFEVSLPSEANAGPHSAAIPINKFAFLLTQPPGIPLNSIPDSGLAGGAKRLHAVGWARMSCPEKAGNDKHMTSLH